MSQTKINHNYRGSGWDSAVMDWTEEWLDSFASFIGWSKMKSKNRAACRWPLNTEGHYAALHTCSQDGSRPFICRTFCDSKIVGTLPLALKNKYREIIIKNKRKLALYRIAQMLKMLRYSWKYSPVWTSACEPCPPSVSSWFNFFGWTFSWPYSNQLTVPICRSFSLSIPL